MADDEISPLPTDLRAAQGVYVGDSGLQVNIFASRSGTRRPWMSPALTGPVTDRPDLYTALAESVLRGGAGPTTLTTAIEGSGGFGKTTLATLLCHDPKVADHFTGGLLWVTVGERSHGARLADLVGGLCEVLSGETTATANPQAAGGRLGELLDTRDPVLLVVDDVWRPEQLAPFMIGGQSCRRLITTRNAGVAPRNGVSIQVEAMTPRQSIATLSNGVGDVRGDLLDRLVVGTGHWPLLLSLVNAALVDHIAAGVDAEDAVRWVLRQLEANGPSVFDTDLGDADNRSHAVETTVDASLALLTPHQRDRYLDLAIIPEDAFIPARLLFQLWHTAGLSAPECEKLRAALVRLRLVLPGSHNGEPAVRLHDILGAYLRHRLAAVEIARRHELMIRTAAELLPPSPHREMQWWSMPADADQYLWHHLPYHLANSGRVEERDALVLDLRWVAAKATKLFSSVPVEIDLADVPGETARSLQHALGTIAELLTRRDRPGGLDATLYCYLSTVPGLEAVVAAYRPHLSAPQLVPAWPLPDQPGLPSRTLMGHTYGIRHCAFSPDGALVASASHDQTARVWDVETGTLVRVLTGHAGAVSACAFSPDGTMLATTGHDQTARVWDVASGDQLAVLSGHLEPVTSCAFSPDGVLLVTTSQDQTVRFWDLASRDCVRILAGHAGGVLASDFSPDGTLLATASDDQTLRVWDVATGEERIVLTGHSPAVMSCAFSPDGTTVATAGEDGEIRLWDIDAGQQVRILAGHEAPVLSCTFSPDGALVASAGCDLTARVWEVATGAQRTVLLGHHEAVTSCAFSPDGALLVTASHDWMLRFWQTGAEDAPSPYRLGWEYTCAFSADGVLLATAGHDRAVRIWDVSTGDLRNKLDGHTDTVSGCTFSPDGVLLATSGYDGTIRLWDIATATIRTILRGHTEEVTDCAFSPDGELVASAGHDGTIRLWDSATGQPVRTLTGHTGAVSACAFSPDGKLIASASHDHTVSLWEVGTGARRAVLCGHTDLVASCAFSPDGGLVASASHDRTSKVWEVASGRLRQTLARHSSAVTDCIFAPDGTLLTSEIGKCQLWMWRLGSDEPWLGLSVATPLLDLAWHPDQPFLCAVGEAGVYLFRYLPHGVRDAGL